MFLLIFMIRFFKQYDSIMPCNMSVLYVPHQKRKGMSNIDDLRVVGDKTHSSL
jgi:hypothetical protein